MIFRYHLLCWLIQVPSVIGKNNELEKQLGPIRVQKADTREYNIPSNKLGDFLDSLKKSLGREGVDVRTIKDGEKLPPFIRDIIYPNKKPIEKAQISNVQQRRYGSYSTSNAYSNKQPPPEQNFPRRFSQTPSSDDYGYNDYSQKSALRINNPQPRTVSTNIGFAGSDVGLVNYERSASPYKNRVSPNDQFWRNESRPKYSEFMRVVPDLNGWRDRFTTKSEANYWEPDHSGENKNLSPTTVATTTAAEPFNTYGANYDIPNSLSNRRKRKPRPKSVISSSLTHQTFPPVVYKSDQQNHDNSDQSEFNPKTPNNNWPQYDQRDEETSDYTDYAPRWPRGSKFRTNNGQSTIEDSLEQASPLSSVYPNFPSNYQHNGREEVYKPPTRDSPNDPYYTAFATEDIKSGVLDNMFASQRKKRDTFRNLPRYVSPLKGRLVDDGAYSNGQQANDIIDVNNALFVHVNYNRTASRGKDIRIPRDHEYRLVKANKVRKGIIKEASLIQPSTEAGCCEKLQELEDNRAGSQIVRKETRWTNRHTALPQVLEQIGTLLGQNGSGEVRTTFENNKVSTSLDLQEDIRGYGYEGYDDYQQTGRKDYVKTDRHHNRTHVKQTLAKRPYNDINQDIVDYVDGITAGRINYNAQSVPAGPESAIYKLLTSSEGPSPKRSYDHHPPAITTDPWPAWSFATATSNDWGPKSHSPTHNHPLTHTTSKVTNVQVKCDYYKNQMSIRLKFSSPFSGIIYAKGFYKIENCRIRGQGETTLVLNLPLTGCGMKTISNGHNLNTGKMKMDNIIIVMFDSLSGVLEAWDTAFRTSCLMGGGGPNKLKAQVDVPMIDTTKDVQPDAATLPPAWMKIVKGKDPFGEPANLLRLGEIGTLVISSAMLNGFLDIFAFDCYAHDGMGMGLIHLLDGNGCPLHGKLIGPQGRTEHDGKAILFAHFKVFKFPDIQNVFFECSIKFCYRHCPPVNCIDTSAVEKGKYSGPSKKYKVKRSASATTTLSDSFNFTKPFTRAPENLISEALNNTTLINNFTPFPLLNNTFNKTSSFHIFQSVMIEMPEEYEGIESPQIDEDDERAEQGNGTIRTRYDKDFEDKGNVAMTENLNPTPDKSTARMIEQYSSSMVNVQKTNQFCLSRVTVHTLYGMMGIMATLTLILSTILYWSLIKGKDGGYSKKTDDGPAYGDKFYGDNGIRLSEFLKKLTQPKLSSTRPIMVSCPIEKSMDPETS